MQAILILKTTEIIINEPGFRIWYNGRRLYSENQNKTAIYKKIKFNPNDSLYSPL